MSLESLAAQLPDSCKDVRLNLTSIAGDDSFSDQTKWGLLLACALTCRHAGLIAAIQEEAVQKLQPQAVAAAQTAAALLSMNNIYYRFAHLAANKEYSAMPARLRMNGLAGHGVDKTDFELWALAVSAINGCSACIDAHEKTLRENNVAALAIQNAVRYAAIIFSAAVALSAAESAS